MSGMDTDPELLLEHTGKMELADKKTVCQLIQHDLLRIVRFQVVPDRQQVLLFPCPVLMLCRVPRLIHEQYQQFIQATVDPHIPDQMILNSELSIFYYSIQEILGKVYQHKYLISLQSHPFQQNISFHRFQDNSRFNSDSSPVM